MMTSTIATMRSPLQEAISLAGSHFVVIIYKGKALIGIHCGDINSRSSTSSSMVVKRKSNLADQGSEVPNL